MENTISKNTVKLNRGQKLCKTCMSVNAARQMVCKTCNSPFSSKSTPVKNQINNWKNLEKDSYFKVVQGSGPYYIASKDSESHKVGEKVCMGYTGVFKVVKVEENGILSYGLSNKNAGYSFIYMGPSKTSKETGIKMEPHKLVKVKIRKRT